MTRKTAAQYMREHKDDFIAFLPSIGGEDTAGATDDGMMDDAGFEKYCRMVAETGEWGGEPEVSLLSCFIILPPVFSLLFSLRLTISLKRKDRCSELMSDSSTIKSVQRSYPRDSTRTTDHSLPRRLGG